MDVVGGHRLDQLVDVEELEPGEERVALVDVGVADVHVAVGGDCAFTSWRWCLPPTNSGSTPWRDQSGCWLERGQSDATPTM